MLFFVPFFITIISTPVIAKFAVNKEVVDKPGLHKTHRNPKPLLGGVAIFIGFAIAVLLFLPVDKKLISLVLATVVLLITGLLDDLYNIKPIFKLAGQAIAASVIVLGNTYLYAVLINYFNKFNIPGFIVLALIIGWIVLMINAFNLIDGLDGLAVGTATVIFMAMVVVSIIEGARLSILGVQLVGLGACLGFLLYNFYPAKIFMGDTGSMLLGFILATTHLFTIKFPFSSQLVLGSMFIFAYPALDISYAIFRRLSNNRSIFVADKGHIHHILLSFGLSVRKTVLLIYLINLAFAALAVVLLLIDLPARYLLAIWIITVTGVIFVFRQLYKISEAKNLCGD